MSVAQVFSFLDDLTVVVPGGLRMRSIVGETLSVGIVDFLAEKGATIAAKAHAHGEEATLQVTGGCTVGLGDDPAGPCDTVELESGVVMIMPAGQSHWGVNRFDAEGRCLRINVVTPPRAEYGAKGATRVYYPGAPTS